MYAVPPEVWMTGQFISSASSLTASPERVVWTRVADQQDRVLGGLDQLGGFGDAVAVGALVDQAIALGRQRPARRRALRG